jgi:lysozyme
MRVDRRGIELIKEFEGLRLKPYLCSANVPTIGYGNTFYENGVKVQLTDPPITEQRADDLLQIIVHKFSLKVLQLVKSDINQNQFNALVSFAFNVGYGRGGLATSTLLKLVNNNPNDANIAKEFLRWNRAGGRVNKGLTNRRIKESAVYFTK